MLNQTKTKQIITFAALCAMIILAGIASAAMPTRPERPDPQARREQIRKDKLEQMSKELEQKAMQVDKQLVNMLELINENQLPNEQTLASARVILEENTANINKFPPELGSEYLMLKAWTEYFSNDNQKAVQSAARAAKMNSSNNDAQITDVAISILTDKKPTIRKKPPQQNNQMMDMQSQRNRSRRKPQQARPGTQFSSKGSSGKILEFDIEAVKPEMFGRKIEPMQLTCANQTSLNCNPTENNLCILLWQLPKEPEEDTDSASQNTSRRNSRTTRPDMRQDPRMMQRPNQPTRPDMMINQRRPEMMQPGMSPEMMMMMMPGMPGMPGQFEQSDPAETLPRETKAFGTIYRSEFTNSDLKFVAINTDETDKTDQVVDEIFRKPQPWPQVLKAQPSSGASQFEDVKLEKPLLTITDKTGTIKYAGPAAGFLAPMILANFTETDLVTVEGTIPDPNAPAEAPSILPNLLPKIIMPKKTQPLPTKPVVNNTDDETITPELFQAGKLYSAADGLFIEAGKKRYITSKKGVELCREVITKYPDTEYANKSRELLRKLSDRDKERYKITNEEMGL